MTEINRKKREGVREIVNSKMQEIETENEIESKKEKEGGKRAKEKTRSEKIMERK